jgi:hypothetical protein
MLLLFFSLAQLGHSGLDLTREVNHRPYDPTNLPYGWMDKCLDFYDYFLQGVVEYQQLITQNPIF